MNIITYQAMLSNPANVARIRAVARAIESVGGKVTIAPPTKVGMVLVMLYLPPEYTPEQFLPGLPFYPV